MRLKKLGLGVRPTGIVRTLTSLVDDGEGKRRYEASIKALEAGRLDAVYIALPFVPKHEILHFYLLIHGEIELRLNIADYLPGDAKECWDRKWRQPHTWAACTGPVSRPEEPFKCTGFQGIRYVEELW